MAIPELKDSKDRLTDCIYFGDPLSASVGSGFVPTNRTISTTAPLAGGGDLSANRTLTVDTFAGSTVGVVPASLGGVVTFLRADGTWATPPTFGTATVGYATASGGGTTNFLRADGTWAVPPGTTIAGLTANFLTVATGATSIGDSRIEQITQGFQFYGVYTSAGDFRSLQVVYDAVNARYTIAPYDVSGVPHFTTLLLRGQGSSAYLEMNTDRMDVVGATYFREVAITLANGLNSDIVLPVPRMSHWHLIVGPTAAFSIGGITKTPSAPVDDSETLVIHNTTAQIMTIVNESLSSSANHRITTGTGANVVVPASQGSVTLIWSEGYSRWVLVSTYPAAQPTRTLGYVPYQNSAGNLGDSTLFYDSTNNRYGFATATPKATVDINGTLATRSYTQVAGAGLNSNLPAPTASVCLMSPAGNYSVGGFVALSGEAGKRLTIRNASTRVMTIVNEDASSTAANRITTGTGANFVMPAAPCSVDLIYDSVTSRWIVTNTSPFVAAGANMQVQYNVAGVLTGDTGLTVAGTGAALSVTLGTDVVLSRKAARHLEMGTPASTTGAQIFTGQSSIGGVTSNKAGGTLSIGGGAGTGTAGGGNTVLMTAYQGVSGNTQNTFAERMFYAASTKDLTDSTPVTVLEVSVDTETGAGGTFYYTIYATDGTDMQILRGSVEWGAVNKAGVVTAALGTPVEADCTPVGTLTVTVTAVDSTANSVQFNLNAASSLTTTVFEAWVAMRHDGRGYISA